MSGADPSTLDRRTLLAAAAGGGVASLAGCSLLESGDDAPTGTVDDEQARSLAERFAPTVYFDRREEWFPTDPRRYESERDDGTVVVDGFDALEGYVTDGGGDDPPEPRVFYNVRRYDDSPLAVVQFWLYSAFDQFTTNFHWHDWELLQVFVDVDSGDPQLYVASSHSRRVPNNEHLDPDPDGRPRVLSELGSHSSGLSVNDDEKQFQRLPPEGDVADITNRVVDGLEDVAGIPLAYGLPRDEGGTLPYVVPELDGVPVYEDDRLPSVSAADLVPEEVTVRSFAALSSPPELPERETGLRYEFEGRDAEADELYDLVPTAELEHIEAFTGPQLSFEFSVPQAAEDAVAGHITTTGTPWKDTRYEAPASDITEATHRQALSERYEAVGEPSPVGQVVAGVTRAVTNDDAPAGAGLETVTASVESVALLQSDPEAVPTFRGVAAVQGVEAGEHTLTVNGAGVAPHGETVPVSGTGTTVAGVDGEIPLVAREMATKVEVEPADGDGRPTAVAVEDDFAGRLYESPVDGPDAVYVHRGGAFTAEVRDDDDDVGAFRVNPADENRVRVENARAGVAPLARYLADVASETRAEVAAVADDHDDDDDDDDDDRGDGSDGSGQENAVQGLARALAAVAEAAERAAERAEAGDRGGAEQRLEAVQTRLDRVASRLSAARESLPPGLARATDNRLDQATRRAEQARNAGKL